MKRQRRSIWVRLFPERRYARRLCLPLAFNGGKRPARFLDDVNLLSRMRPPEVILSKLFFEIAFFEQFHEYKILPERPDIVAQVEVIKLRDDGITHSVVQKDRKSTRLNSSHSSISYSLFF